MIHKWKKRLGLRRVKVFTERKDYLAWCREAKIRPADWMGGAYYAKHNVVWANPLSVKDFEPLLLHELLHARDCKENGFLTLHGPNHTPRIDRMVYQLCGKRTQFAMEMVRRLPKRWAYYCPRCRTTVCRTARALKGRRWHRVCVPREQMTTRNALVPQRLDNGR